MLTFDQYKSKKRIEIEKEARQLWKDILIAYTNSSNSTSVDSGVIWADKVTEEFKNRYGHKES